VTKLKHDLIGKRFGHFTVLERVLDRTKSLTQWKCKCDCGTVKVMTGLTLRRSKSDPPINCGCLKYLGKPKNIRHKDPGAIAINHVYSQYKYAAKRRRLEWSLSAEEFNKLIQQNCYFCGSKPNREYNPYKWQAKVVSKRREESVVVVNGIDRLDSAVGYNSTNCVPACTQCNYAKRNTESQDFLAWIEKIHTHQTQKVNSIS
jgi:hypothetical protein